ncbi:hypothetical protein [Actinospongicola halichondriae]|uniref:hypothetical protein n=1 Tax=Actinospongicola halichondriae TaxID=3236844 RepID=UPI003D3CCE8F
MERGECREALFFGQFGVHDPLDRGEQVGVSGDDLVSQALAGSEVIDARGTLRPL